MNEIIKQIFIKAKSNLRKIILADAHDPRIQSAAKISKDQKIANIILLTDDYIKNNPQLQKNLSQNLFDLRKDKGLSLSDSQKLITQPIYFGTMMVKNGLANGLVSGAASTTHDTFKPALQILKTAPDQKIVSSFFVMEFPNQKIGQEGIMIFADCGLNVSPNSEMLAEITKQSINSFKQLVGSTPKVALLSYSTNGSGFGPTVDLVQQATKIIKSQHPDLIIEGEIQADAAINPFVSFQKNPESVLGGKANILIFPDLNSGNIAYKLVERLSQAKAYGPISQGITRPVNDLSRGCSVEDIVTTIAITAVQSQTL
jgi:phosphate acetyltransferase